MSVSYTHLDGLPIESYIEKGVLEDLSDIITPMVKAGELYPNIAESFTGSDGSVYQMCIRDRVCSASFSDTLRL